MKYVFVISAVMLLAGPAMAGGTTHIEKTTPPTELEICTINLRNMKDFMSQVQAQIAAAPAAAVPLPVAKPAKVTARKKAKGPVRHSAPRVGGCKKGRTRNAQGLCGVWS